MNSISFTCTLLFSTCMFLYLKYVSCTKQIGWSCLKKKKNPIWRTLPLIGGMNPFSFNAIIDMVLWAFFLCFLLSHLVLVHCFSLTSVGGWHIFYIPFILCVNFFLAILLFLLFVLEMTIISQKSLWTSLKSHYASFYTVSVPSYYLASL